MITEVFRKVNPLLGDHLYIGVLEDGSLLIEIARENGERHSVYLMPEESLRMTAKVTTGVFPFTQRSV